MTARLPTVGVDIGGSKIGVGLVDRGGRIIRHPQVPTPAREGAEAILSAARTTIRSVVGHQLVDAVGIGAAGVIDPEGVVVAATNLLTGWTGTDIVRAIDHGLGSDDIDCPVIAVNDVHAHGAGEAWCGAGAGSDLVLLIAVGTGLGGAVIHHGVPLTGAHGASGHLGHRSATALGAAIGDLINIVDPDLVVISGSVSQAGSAWWREVHTAARATCLNITTHTPIVPAMLGEHAGAIGAASLAARAAALQEAPCQNC